MEYIILGCHERNAGLFIGCRIEVFIETNGVKIAGFGDDNVEFDYGVVGDVVGGV